MSRLSILDNVFLQIESAATPMHVAGLLLFRHPAHERDFTQRLVSELRTPVPCGAPFDRRLQRTALALRPGRWESVPGFAPAAHVHEARCAAPGTARELGALIAGLHTRQLDLAHPPWECHVVHGLADQRAAIYYKMHHAAIDGVSGLRRMQQCLSADPDQPATPMWQARPPRSPRPPRPSPSRRAIARELVGAVRTHLRLRREHGAELPDLFAAPRTSLNRMLTARRAVATLDLDLAAVHARAASAGSTVNDLALALVAGALRRYLLARGELPSTPLVAFVPISLHDAQSQDQLSNRVCNVLVALPTHLADTGDRLRWVHASMALAKRFIHTLSPAASTAFSMLLGAPAIVGQMLGLSPHLPPPFKVVVSNVSGPRQRLYQSGAALEALYPVSALFEGQGVNITLVSYLDRLSIGLVGCPDVCDVDEIAAALGAAWRELAA